MGYLTERIRSDLQSRVDLHGKDVHRWLLIDFMPTTLVLGGKHVSHFSLLDGDRVEDLLNELDQPFDGAVVNLQFGWFDPDSMVALLKQLLAPGGRLFFSTPGPDTLAELRALWAQVDDAPHVHRFIDMHHLGDKLLRNGFKKPIMDADWIGVEYDDLDLLMQDLCQEGMQNVLVDRRKTLTGKGRIERLGQLAKRQGDRLQVTFEIVYGYAEAPDSNPGMIKVRPPQFNAV